MDVSQVHVTIECLNKRLRFSANAWPDATIVTKPNLVVAMGFSPPGWLQTTASAMSPCSRLLHCGPYESLLPTTVPGFRDRAELLDSTFLRMGMLAVLRSRYVSRKHPSCGPRMRAKLGFLRFGGVDLSRRRASQRTVEQSRRRVCTLRMTTALSSGEPLLAH